MKTRITVLLLALLAIVVAISVSPIQAAPPATLYGPEPLYDSGWVRTTSGYQSFSHDLQAFPTLWTLTVADDYTGDGAAGSPNAFVTTSGYYGHLVVNILQMDLEVLWLEDGIGYSKHMDKWYQRGTDYARLRIFALDHPD